MAVFILQSIAVRKVLETVASLLKASAGKCVPVEKHGENSNGKQVMGDMTSRKEMSHITSAGKPCKGWLVREDMNQREKSTGRKTKYWVANGEKNMKPVISAGNVA